MADLFQNLARTQDAYSAKDIEVLEGLEPVRRRPGMYVGGTDERALHHLVAEILKVGRTSVTVRVETWIDRNRSGDSYKVTEGTFVYVAIDDCGRPRPVSGPT